MAVWYNLWPFGIVCGSWYIFPHFYVWIKKNLATLPQNFPDKKSTFKLSNFSERSMVDQSLGW
jgi:hypothetical protein